MKLREDWLLHGRPAFAFKSLTMAIATQAREQSWFHFLAKTSSISKRAFQLGNADDIYVELVTCRAFDRLLQFLEGEDEDRLESIQVRHLIANASRMENGRRHMPLPPTSHIIDRVQQENELIDTEVNISRMAACDALAALAALGVPQSDVATWCSVSPSYLSRVRTARKSPSERLLFEVRKYLALRLHFRLGNAAEIIIPRRGGDPLLPLREYGELVELRDSAVNETGVFALIDFRPGDIIGEITGQIIREKGYDSNYCFELTGAMLEPKEPFRRLNHSCCSNAIYYEVDGETSVSGSSMILEAAENIARGDEITIDYGIAESQEVPCNCGNDECRGWVLVSGEPQDC